jgi:hypothetical protein
MLKLAREIRNQLVKKNGNKSWLKELKVGSKNERNNERDSNDLFTYLQANRIHHEMIQQYYPASTLTPAEKIKRTANRVGFNLPKMVGENKD